MHIENIYTFMSLHLSQAMHPDEQRQQNFTTFLFKKYNNNHKADD